MKHIQRLRMFCECIERWFLANRRDLPWRNLPDKNPAERAYKVLVSEVMLQQTQVPRVTVSFKTFLTAFPTIESLAGASNKEVLLAWRGMGYNSRALRLRDAAKQIVSGWLVACTELCRSAGSSLPRKRGRPATSNKSTSNFFPSSMEELLKIPGIGPYTAAAIRNFAFDMPTPCIDTNIRRVLHRTFHGPENADGAWRVGDSDLLPLAAEVLKISGELGMNAGAWHSALMDYGSLVQTKRNPKWDCCPLTSAGLMKAKKAQYPLSADRLPLTARQEPGREIAGRFVPNRIIRGRVVEELRDSSRGMTLMELGERVCIDWSAKEHTEWLQILVEKLVREELLVEQKKKYFLHH